MGLLLVDGEAVILDATWYGIMMACNAMVFVPEIFDGLEPPQAHSSGLAVPALPSCTVSTTHSLPL